MNFKRPLVLFLTFYLAGILFFKTDILIIVLIELLLFVILLAYLNQQKRKNRMNYGSLYCYLCLPILFIFGCINMRYHAAPHPMEAVFQDEINGVVQGELVGIEEKGYNYLLTLKNNTIHLNQSEIIYHSRRLSISISYKPNYKIGNILSVNGKILKFQKASNPGQYDEYLYNKINGIDYKVKAEQVSVVSNQHSRFYQFLYNLKRKMIHVYQKLLPEKDAGILSAMILGDNNLLDKEVKKLYQQSGISHILSISGLHVSLLGMSIYKLLRKLKVPLIITTLLSVGIIFTYGVLTNFSVSTNRAVVMLIILMFSGNLGRTYDLLSAMSLSALIILIQSPLQIKSAGFLLSYGAILGIGLLNPILTSYISIKNRILDGIIMSISIQIITLPVLLYYFYEFPSYSIIVNVIILPLSSIIVLMAILSGIVGCFSIPMGIFLVGSVHLILEFFEKVCRMVSTLPGKIIITGRPSGIIIITYIMVLLLFILINTKQKSKKSILLLSFLLIIFNNINSNNLEVTFLDVGQGDGIFMKTPSGSTYLIDGGSGDVKEVGKYRIVPFLKQKGIAKINYAIITHADEDHISGLKELIAGMKDNDIRIETLIVPNIYDKDEAYQNLVSLAYQNKINVLSIEKEDYFKDQNVSITCLHPSNTFKSKSSNAYSTVLSVRYGQFDLLLTGDLEADGEEMIRKDMADRLRDLDPSQVFFKDSKSEQTFPRTYDILKVAHHGSKNSTGMDFLNQIRPKIAIISAGKDNSYGHPHIELLNRLNSVNCDIKVTYDCGAITFITNGIKLEVKEYLKRVTY